MNIATTLRTEMPQPVLSIENVQPDLLTEAIHSRLGNPERSSDIDLHAATTISVSYTHLTLPTICSV